MSAQIVVNGPATGNGATTTVVQKPAGVQDGDLLLCVFDSQTNNQTATSGYVPPAGWTIIWPWDNSKSGRITTAFYKVIPSASAESATNYTFTNPLATGSRSMGQIFIVRGYDPNVTITLGSWGSTLTPCTTTPTAPSAGLLVCLFNTQATAGNSSVLTSFSDGSFTTVTWNSQSSLNQTVVTTSTGSAGADDGASRSTAGVFVKNVASGTPGAAQSIVLAGSASAPTGISFLIKDAPTFQGTATGTVVWAGSASGSAAYDGSATGGVTWAGTAAGYAPTGVPVGQASGALAWAGSAVGNKPVKGSATGTVSWAGSAIGGSTPIKVWYNARPTYTAHRGGSSDWPEGTMYAYDQAAAWSTTVALEVSCWQSSDGVWVSSHDQTTGRVFGGTSYDIKVTPWATLSTLRTIVGNQPMAKVVDILDKHAKGTRVLVMDNKGGQDNVNFWNLIDSYGGKDRFIAKCYGVGHTITDVARARGYLAWGYYFDGDTPNIAANAPFYDILGEDFGATQATWNTIMAQGKPVWPHILATAAQKTTADNVANQGIANGGTGYVVGYMASGVQEVVPFNPVPTQGSATGTVVWAGAATGQQPVAIAARDVDFNSVSGPVGRSFTVGAAITTRATALVVGPVTTTKITMPTGPRS